MDLNESVIEEIIRKVLNEQLKGSTNNEDYKTIDRSGIIHIDTKKVECEKFPFPIDTDKVTLKDVVTVEESPRLGVGVMEIDKDELAWTLKYDELDYVISGTLEIEVDGRVITANEGEMILIPKDSTIKFKSPNKARFIYVVYPANWADL